MADVKSNMNFNLQIDNLPTLIKKLVINKRSYYNLDLNFLPDYVEELQLNRFYKKNNMYSFKY